MPYRLAVDKVVATISRLTFLAHPVGQRKPIILRAAVRSAKNTAPPCVNHGTDNYKEALALKE